MPHIEPPEVRGLFVAGTDGNDVIQILPVFGGPGVDKVFGGPGTDSAEQSDQDLFDSVENLLS